MIRKFLLPLLAAAGALFALYRSLHAAADAEDGQTPLPGPAPARAAFAERVSGAGILEAAGENIALGAPVSGLVLEVLGRPGDRVKAGQPLFQLDDRAARAGESAARQRVELAKAELAEAEARPRPEEIAPAEARLAQAQAALADAEAQARRAEALFAQGVLPEEERIARVSDRDGARARMEEASSALALLRAGTWAPTLAALRARCAAAEAEAAQADVERARYVLAAPTSGTLLRVFAKPGEYATAGGPALAILGDLSALHVRADIDEQDAHRVSAGAPAVAFPRGEPGRALPLSFVRVEPLVVPKRNLTGDNLERVDTRVLQVIFRVTDPAGLFVGQQVDVQIALPLATPRG
jgi:multidrug efflux pump subunit AcrA (membrane-fusion protein)